MWPNHFNLCCLNIKVNGLALQTSQMWMGRCWFVTFMPKILLRLLLYATSNCFYCVCVRFQVSLPYKKCDTTNVSNICIFVLNFKCLLPQTRSNWVKAGSLYLWRVATFAFSLVLDDKTPPKYLNWSTSSTRPPLMVTSTRSWEVPLPTYIIFVFDALMCIVKCSAVLSMAFNISTRFFGFVENSTMSYVEKFHAALGPPFSFV